MNSSWALQWTHAVWTTVPRLRVLTVGIVAMVAHRLWALRGGRGRGGPASSLLSRPRDAPPSLGSGHTLAPRPGWMGAARLPCYGAQASTAETALLPEPPPRSLPAARSSPLSWRPSLAPALASSTLSSCFFSLAARRRSAGRPRSGCDASSFLPVTCRPNPRTRFPASCLVRRRTKGSPFPSRIPPFLHSPSSTPHARRDAQWRRRRSSRSTAAAGLPSCRRASTALAPRRVALAASHHLAATLVPLEGPASGPRRLERRAQHEPRHGRLERRGAGGHWVEREEREQGRVARADAARRRAGAGGREEAGRRAGS